MKKLKEVSFLFGTLTTRIEFDEIPTSVIAALMKHILHKADIQLHPDDQKKMAIWLTKRVVKEEKENDRSN